MRRIAYVTPLYFGDESCVGGGERYPQNLAKGVVQSTSGRFGVDIISFGRKRMCRGLFPGVRLRVIEAAGRPKDAVDVVSWDLPATLEEYDLVHVHQSHTRCGEVTILVAKQLQKMVCVTDHGAYSSTLGVEYGLHELVDAYVAYSDFGARLAPTNRVPMHIIKGGVDTAAFTPPETKPIRDGISYVGRLLPHKGIDDLINAMPPDLRLTVCGRVYHEDYFKRLQALGAAKNVEFLVDADDARIVEVYRSALANVLPSVYRDCYGDVSPAPELMGFTLLEAMSCGTPAICSRVAAMPEFIREGETGFVFDSVEHLNSIIVRLAREPELAHAIGQRASEVVRAEFDLNVAGAALAQVYDDLIDRNQQREAA